MQNVIASFLAMTKNWKIMGFEIDEYLVGKWQFFVNGKLESEEDMNKPKKPQLKKDRVKTE